MHCWRASCHFHGRFEDVSGFPYAASYSATVIGWRLAGHVRLSVLCGWVLRQRGLDSHCSWVGSSAPQFLAAVVPSLGTWSSTRISENGIGSSSVKKLVEQVPFGALDVDLQGR